MSELTQTLKILVTRYPGTMAELARKASIDRSTLYKIVSGQRTRGSPAGAPGRRAGIERGTEIRPAAAIQAAWPRPRSQAARRAAPPAGGLFPGGGFHPPRGHYLQRSRQPAALQRAVHRGSRAVAAAVASLVANHILSGDTRPLLLSPFTNPTLDHVLVERFSAADGAPVALSQLLIYPENRDIPREWVSACPS